MYESRLDQCRLPYADFDLFVGHMVAKPFMLKSRIIVVPRQHSPDYLLITEAGPVVVAVKPNNKLEDIARGEQGWH